jgi:hypothetical protein
MITKPKKRKEKKEKKIKAWAILEGDKNNTFSHVAFDKSEAYSWEGFAIVPCTITYTLPCLTK